MPINPHWQQYQQQLTHILDQLRDSNDSAMLLALSRQLTQQRLTLTDVPALLWQHFPSLNSVLRQTELLLTLCSLYRWPEKIRQLLLQASFCSALASVMSAQARFAKLQSYPALLAARLLQAEPGCAALLAVLSASYPTERNIAPWQQNPLSIVLTETEYLADITSTGSEIALRQQIGRRIALAKSETELCLLRRLLTLATTETQTDSAPVNAADWLHSSGFAQLCEANTLTLERYLTQSPTLAAPVLELASKLNRQQQPIRSVRLALSLLGRTRLPFILAHAELQHNLLQLNHPLQRLYLQFSACLAHALQLLLPDQLSDANSQALALCLCTPLWLNDSDFASALVRRHNTQGLYCTLDSSSYRREGSADVVMQLLLHYRLSEWQRAAADCLHCLATDSKPTTKLGLTLQLAWRSCMVLLANNDMGVLQPLMQLAPQQQLLNKGTQTWLSQLAADSHCYYPLELTL